MRTAILIILFVSCNVSRKVSETDTNTKEESQSVVKTKRTIEEKLPNEKISGDIIPKSERILDSVAGLYKEFIDKQSSGPLTKTIIYKPDGTTSVECELEEFYRKIIEEIIENKSSQKKENVEKRNVDKQIDTNIDWTFVVLIVIAGILLFKKI